MRFIYKTKARQGRKREEDTQPDMPRPWAQEAAAEQLLEETDQVLEDIDEVLGD